MPEFEAAAEKLKQYGVTLAKVDCTREHILSDRFNINSYPSLRIFYKDKIYHYHGPRDEEEMVAFMIKHLE
jgi:hypothetical protein